MALNLYTALYQHWIIAGLSLAVTRTALMVVWSTHETRTLINTLLSMRTQANAMMVEYGQLQLQERAVTSAAEIELKVAETLMLHFPGDDEIEVLLP